MMRLLLLMMIVLNSPCWAKNNVLNLFVYEGIIAEAVIRDFEEETGIKVNVSSFDTNETLFAKLKAVRRSDYDIIMPSSYYIQRLKKWGLLHPLDKGQLPNLKNIDPFFSNPSYDPGLEYSVPYIWGTTGVVVNQQYYKPTTISTWHDLWQQRFTNRLLLLDDLREVFAVAMLSLGYSINDSNPEHIKQAYQQLKKLSANIKVFSTGAAESIYVDDDALVGMIWNGGFLKVRKDNVDLRFIYPQDGFAIWVDNLAIYRYAPHLENAHRFIDYLLRAKVAKISVMKLGYATANKAARLLLPKELRSHPILYPSQKVLERGEFLMDVSDQALKLYEHYWQRLKLQL